MLPRTDSSRTILIDVYRTISVLVYTFGLAAFIGLFALWTRQLRLGRTELRSWLYPAIFTASAGWFALNILVPSHYFILLAGACVFPALLGKLFGSRGIPFVALASVVIAVLSLLYTVHAIQLAHAQRDLSIAFCAVFAWTCATAARAPGSGRTSVSLLIAIMILIPVAMFTFGDWLSLLMRSLPLPVLMVHSYSRRRFLFLDLFAKWGSNFAVALVALTVWFSLQPADLDPIYSALLMLPVLWGVFRLCRSLGELLDRCVLGRPYSPAEAQRVFLERLQNSETEATLLCDAHQLAEHIFHTRASITADGVISLEDRLDGRPLFSEDLSLVKTLSEMLHFLLENRRLEEKRRTLLLEAGRSELKALRAQINPHFLFNALNTVAGLIPSNPELAEETVEKLAEVFRYILQRSETEMEPLSQELEFIRSWLDVQQARFGQRLRVEIHADSDALAARVPAMTLQPLVENALKHGVAVSSEPCLVSIRACLRGDTLVLTVTDTGPGPRECGPDSGHGLKNVRERLAGYYGERGRLTLSRDADLHVTTATIELPV
ncbi:histidine kinase [uncultured Paludibaculum sp.]|uniref:sensor histidine kinase n=1 Tax=uncultured Paludibaculum sp. TaxID=1765020 RepID=UPI002AABF5E4|nr:histidine kinase [uncultured Paludibaculum sp.]